MAHDPRGQAEFWSHFAERYDSTVDRQLGGNTREMVRQRMVREHELGCAVELGCGTGFFTDALARAATTLLATDISPGMLDVARHGVMARNVTFQVEDCQHTSLPDGAFDTAFMGLVIHFTDPPGAAREIHRILRPGGRLVIANVDPMALDGMNRLRCRFRVLCYGIAGARMKPPKGFGRDVMTEGQLRDVLTRCGFRVDAAETIRDDARSSNIPVEYVRATKL